jgi:MFS family permease
LLGEVDLVLEGGDLRGGGGGLHLLAEAGDFALAVFDVELLGAAEGFFFGRALVASARATSAWARAWRPRVNPWIVALTVTLATFMEVLDSSIANVALPHIAGGLGATQDEATWVLTAYLVANAVILPAGAYMTTFIGRKKFYMICVALFGISSALCGLAPTLPLLVFLPRFCRGLAAAGWLLVSRRSWRTRFRRRSAGRRLRCMGWRWCARRRSGRRWAGTLPTTSTGAGSSF